MKQSEEQEKRITKLVMGTRLDHVPAPETQGKLYSRLCAECQMELVTESEYPETATIVCNVCMPTVAKRLTQENDAQLAFDMPPDAKARLMDIARNRNIPYETLLQEFVAWRTGKLMDGKVYDPTKAEENN